MEPLKFRVMTPKDVPFALKLVEVVGWDQTRSDVERNLSFEPNGCFVATLNQIDVGIIDSFLYGKVGFIGNVIVDPNHRGKGIGEAMMVHAISRLRNEGVGSIRLDAVPKAITLYKRLGFKPEWSSLRFVTQASKQKEDTTIPITKADLKEISRLDVKYFGLNRLEKLILIQNEFPGYCYKSMVGNDTVGYIMAREVRDGVKVGPWICEPEYAKNASDLLKTIMNKTEGRTLKVGVPESNHLSVGIVEGLGFKNLPASIRMCAGSCVSVEKIEGIFSVGAPDKG